MVPVSRHYDPYHDRTHSGALGGGFWGVCQFLYRWHLGRPIFRFPGQRPTDATFFHRGTKPRSEWDRLTPWSYLPEGIRAAVRIWVFEVLPFLGIAWWWTSSIWYGIATITAVVASLALLGWLGWRYAHNWRFKRRYVRPLRKAVSGELRTRLPDSAVDVPKDFLDKDTNGVVIQLPGGQLIDQATQKALTACVAQRLSMPSPNSTVRGLGNALRLVVTPAYEPPAVVRWCDLLPAIEACAPGEVVLGIDAHNQVFKASFKTGNPHFGFSVNTQRGKSTQGQSIVAQILHQDPRNRASYIDPKMVSCAPLAGTPGLTLANDPFDVPAMWRAVEGVYDDLMFRRRALAEDPTTEFGIHLFVVDELSEFADMSRDEWRNWKTQRPDEWHKGDPPITRHMKSILRMGGQFGIHVVFYTQRLDVASCFGVAGLRDLLGLRGLAGYKPNQWKMLVGTTPVPPPQEGIGRWIYSVGPTTTWVQNVFASHGSTKEERDACWEQEIRDWAQAGRKHATPIVVPGEVVEESAPVHVEAERLYTAVQVSQDEGQGIVPMSFTAIRQAKYRAKKRGEEWPDSMSAEQWQDKLRRLEVVADDPGDHRHPVGVPITKIDTLTRDRSRCGALPDAPPGGGPQR